jgi:hypothetical protein
MIQMSNMQLIHNINFLKDELKLCLFDCSINGQPPWHLFLREATWSSLHTKRINLSWDESTMNL